MMDDLLHCSAEEAAASQAVVAVVVAVVAPAFAEGAVVEAAAAAAAAAVEAVAEKIAAVDHTEAEGLESVYAARSAGCLHDMALETLAARTDFGQLDSGLDLDQVCSETVADRTAGALLEALEIVAFPLSRQRTDFVECQVDCLGY